MMSGNEPMSSANLHRLVPVVRRAGGGRLEPDLLHGLLEELTILSLVDGVQLGADELDAVFLQGARLGESLREVERGLAAHGGQQRVGLLLDDDLLHSLGGHRTDVRAVRGLGVRHDRRGVGVEQNHIVSLRAERLARLGAGVIELARLADDDGTGAEDHDFLDVGALVGVGRLVPRAEHGGLLVGRRAGAHGDRRALGGANAAALSLVERPRGGAQRVGEGGGRHDASAFSQWVVGKSPARKIGAGQTTRQHSDGVRAILSQRVQMR
jgi:hypothetical protein